MTGHCCIARCNVLRDAHESRFALDELVGTRASHEKMGGSARLARRETRDFLPRGGTELVARTCPRFSLSMKQTLAAIEQSDTRRDRQRCQRCQTTGGRAKNPPPLDNSFLCDCILSNRLIARQKKILDIVCTVGRVTWTRGPVPQACTDMWSKSPQRHGWERTRCLSKPLRNRIKQLRLSDLVAKNVQQC